MKWNSGVITLLPGVLGFQKKVSSSAGFQLIGGPGFNAMSSEKRTQDGLTYGANGELVATAPTLARWLGVTGKTIYDLAKAGVLVRANREHFLLEESIRRYCDHIRVADSKH